DNLGRIRKRSTFDSGRFIPPTTRPVQTTAPETETWTYDGLVKHYVNARGIESTSEIDAESRVVRTVTLPPAAGPHQVVSRYEYGPFGVLQAITDPAGNRIENKHDALGRVYDITDPSAGHSTIQYNGYGEAKYFLDGAGIATFIWHDLLGRVKEAWHVDPTYT